MTSPSALRVAIIGMGGFAAAHHKALLKLEALGHARLVATCDPHPGNFAAECDHWHFSARGIRVFGDYRTLFRACDSELDYVVIPTPIPLHAEMHRAAVEHGIPVYLEKPPTLDPAELEAMITTDRSAAKTTLVGFNYIVEKPRLALKQRMLAGEFGRLTGVGLLAQWPRPASYFQRNDWAGCLLSANGQLILDSCFANAMSHYVHNVLHWAGTRAVLDWAAPLEVKAELYRGHEIEGTDTVFAEAATDTGACLRIAMTHACAGEHTQTETLMMENATIHYVVDSHYDVVWNNGHTEHLALPPFDSILENHLAYHAYLLSESHRPATRLSDCRPFVHFNALNYISSGEIVSFPDGDRERVTDARDPASVRIRVRGLPEAMTAFLDNGSWPGATRAWPRKSPAIAARPPMLDHLTATIHGMGRKQTAHARSPSIPAVELTNLPGTILL
ncbi:MAG: Gfo/Idh/MocA family oxidoreductase [Opitutaceae bacterium]|jgi:predicted dehydrogenase